MWRRTVIEKYGDFDKSLQYIMDYEYWLRIAHNGGRIRYLPMKLANSRLYKETKTKSGREYIFKEIFCVTKKLFGKTSIHWTLQYAQYILEEKYRLLVEQQTDLIVNRGRSLSIIARDNKTTI